MARGLQNYQGGTTDEYGTLLVVDRQMQSGVIEGLLVAANGTPNMTVLVQPGSGLIPTGTYPSSYNYRFHIDTALPGESVTIGTAAASPRIDYIVAYVNKTVAGSTAGANVNNTNNILQLADVQGTPAGSPSVPTVSQIQSTIGASNPYVILAQIAVGANVTTITNTNITDLRTFASDRNDAALGQGSYIDSGLFWTATSGLAATMGAGTAHINVGGTMVPTSAVAISSYTFTASQDTYVSLNVNGVINYSPVPNGTSAPTLPAKSVWVAIVTTNSGSVVTINQTGVDSNGNLVRPIGTGNKQVDGNGWTVLDFNGRREFVKRWIGLFNTTIAANSSAYFTIDNLPVGIANTSNFMIEHSATGGSGTDGAIASKLQSNAAGADSTSSTLLQLVLRNTYASASVGSGYWELVVRLR